MTTKVSNASAEAKFMSSLDELATQLRNRGYKFTTLQDEEDPERPFAFRVKDDDMNDGTRDSFQEGDIVLCREICRADRREAVARAKGSFWVIIYNDATLLRQITGTSEDGAAIVCHSLNLDAKLPDVTIKIDNVSRLFQVVQLLPKARHI